MYRSIPTTAFILLGVELCCAGELITAAPGRAPYTWEEEGHLVLRTAAELQGRKLSLEALHAGRTIIEKQPIEAGGRISLPLPLDRLPQGNSEVTCRLTGGGELLEAAQVRIARLAPKPHVVKIDYVRRGLLVDDQPFFPFGFYCELPLGSLPDDEVTQGFNIIAPYLPGPRASSPEPLAETRAYLDRCAAIGMKVVYDLRPVAERKPSDRKWALLRAEVEAFRDHPALLCWITSDEPADKKIEPALLTETYEFIKKVDPYHPVTMVFCAHRAAARYVSGLDFVLADWYPIAHSPVSTVAEAARNIKRATGDLMPWWFVPQAFGGSWHWTREPSAREQRVMTYLGLIHDATGIQYFIRRPPNGNPMSPILWSECRRLALETAELAPALLSRQSPPEAACSPATVHATARQDRGYYTVIAANTENHPDTVRLQLKGTGYSGKAEVLFENRRVDVTGGVIEEMIDAFGTRAYRVPVDPLSSEEVAVDPQNLTTNPSFEQAANVGTPDGCYANRGGDLAASMFIDPWVARHGLHSLRFTVPTKGRGLNYVNYWMPLKKGTRYRLSIWAKAKTAGSDFEMSFADLGIEPQRFELTTVWKEYALTGVAERNIDRATRLQMRFIGPGTAWFDLLQVVPTAAPAAEPTTHMVPMRDGTRLATDVYLPDGNGPWPAMLMRTPYGRRVKGIDALGMEAAGKGYVLVSQDIRGRGDSEGHHSIIFRNGGWGKRQDGYDTVEWIARQAWNNGKVGTWGGSALGITQNMMAPSRPPHLVCQHVTYAFSDMYADCAYPGGAWRTRMLEGWLEATKMLEVNLEAFVNHPRYDEFWAQLDATSQAARVNVPVLFVGGWYDICCQGTINAFVAIQEKGDRGARGKCRLVMGPTGHGEIKELKYPRSDFPQAADVWRWFDYWLEGKDNGVAAEPAVHYYVMGDPEDDSAPGNHWRTTGKWPPPSTPTPYYLHQDKRLSTTRPDDAEASLSYEYDPQNPVPTVGGANLLIPLGPMDQRTVEKRPDVLVFTTSPLTRPVEITGRIKVKLWISSSARDTDFTAKLCDVYPDGRSMLVTDGILRARYHESFRTEKLLEPGEIYPIEIDLWSTSLIFNKGHRIRVSISSSNSPRFEPNPNTGAPFRADNRTIVARNTVHMARSRPSHIVLPVVDIRE